VIRRLLRSLRRRDDDGVTLIEVMVSMGVMSVVMVVFTGAILQAFRTTAKTETISYAQSQLQIAFQRVDKEVRYASWIAVPAKVGTAWYVEYANFDGTSCGQLRFETAPSADAGNQGDAKGILSLLIWPRDTAPAAGVAGLLVAKQLLDPGSSGPFERTDPASAAHAGFTPDFQRLRIRLTSQVGGGQASDSTAQMDTTFTALNTSRNTPADNDCSNGRPS
jgi:prepilin-type N-terminal cleavage/methylation domain-containing protein